MYMLLCLEGRNIHVIVSWRKECTYYCGLEEGIYMLLCLGGRNVHVTVSGRKEYTCCSVWKEAIYMLLCLGVRNVHVTVSGRKGCTCFYRAWEEEMYPTRGKKKRTRFYLPRLGGRNSLCCYCVRVKEMCL